MRGRSDDGSGSGRDVTAASDDFRLRHSRAGGGQSGDDGSAGPKRLTAGKARAARRGPRLASRIEGNRKAEHRDKEGEMSVAKVSEISATSAKSFEDAVQQGLTRASKTLRNVRGAWIKEQHVRCDNGKITEYQVNMMVTFILDD
jgi:hypothetical protein